MRSLANLHSTDVVPLQARPPPLAIVHSPWTDVNYGANRGVVRVTLTVRQDPLYMDSNAVSRLHYEARFYLIGENDAPPMLPVEIGIIDSYKLSKSTSTMEFSGDEIETMPWVTQFLDPNNLPADPEVHDMCSILQGLFNPKGRTVALQTLRRNQQVKSSLSDDSLVHIKLVGILVAFQGQGLSHHMFDLYYECLRTLPECESISSSSLLVFMC